MAKEADIRTDFVDANGLRFEVHACGEGDRLALCLHGFPEHAHSWRHQLPTLAGLGYRAWAPNLRGYGASSRPHGVQAYALEALMDDVAGLIDASGARETVLLAHDWGAVIAWFFAMREIRPLQRLVICNVPHPAAALQARSWEQLKKSWYIGFFQLPAIPERLLGRSGARGVGEMIRRTSASPERFSDRDVAVYSDNAAQPGALTAMLNYYRALLRGGGYKRQRALGFPIIRTPTLMIWGEDDLALTKETTFGTERYVQDLTIRYLPRVSHWVQQDQPEVVNAMLSAFLTAAPVPEMSWQVRLSPPDG